MIVLVHPGNDAGRSRPGAEAAEALANRGRSAPDVSRLSLNLWQSADSQWSVNAALQIGLPVVDVSANLQSRVLVRDMRASTEVETSEEIQIWGVSLRLVITVSAQQLDAKMTSSLPIVSAHAQLQNLRADARLAVLGFTDEKIFGMLPDFSTLDVDSYGKYTAASDAIKHYIPDHPDKICPALLERRRKPADDQDDFSIAVATARALQAMADGRSLSWVLNRLDGSTIAKSAARDVWRVLAPEVPEDAEAPEWVQGQAEQILVGK